MEQTHKHRNNLIGFLIIILFSFNVFAAEDAPVVGRGESPETETGKEAAGKYMKRSQRSQMGSDDHYLTLHAGAFVSSTAYEWGSGGQQKDPGRSNFGVTYRMGEWIHTLDLLFRADFTFYDLPTEQPFKMTLIPLFVFPDSASRFPLYFGGGIGPGIFFKQTSGSSAVSLDYQLVAGARFFDLYQNMGVFIETGLKNHLHLLSSGQFNGVFVAIGGVFAF